MIKRKGLQRFEIVPDAAFLHALIVAAGAEIGLQNADGIGMGIVHLPPKLLHTLARAHVGEVAQSVAVTEFSVEPGAVAAPGGGKDLHEIFHILKITVKW